MEALAVDNLTTIAYVFVRMQVRLSRTLQNTPLLAQAVTSMVQNIEFYDREPCDWRAGMPAGPWFWLDI